MKCKSCGYNLSIEDGWCPHCGTKNEAAKQHNADMEKYSREFEETLEEVKSNSRRFNAITVKIMITAVLALLVAICVIISANGYEIAYRREQKVIKKNLAVHMQALDEFERNRDVRGFTKYYENNRLSNAETGSLSQYAIAAQLSRYYCGILDDIVRLVDESQLNSYYNKDLCLDKIEKNIEYIKQYREPKAYNGECFEGIQGEYVDYVVKLTEDTLQVYFNLSDEEAGNIWDMSSGRMYVMLEEGLEND
ncbi:MAG: hypothetical protein KBS96_07455 [Lachnospiraceae bacterium]|nr:hypothetical protein [Candidatus Colinaster scatohippi]